MNEKKETRSPGASGSQGHNSGAVPQGDHGKITSQYPYLPLYLKNIPADRQMAISSAAGVASQIPVTPKTAGRTIMVMSINTKDLENARTADTIPLDRAVNMPLA